MTQTPKPTERPPLDLWPQNLEQVLFEGAKPIRAKVPMARKGKHMSETPKNPTERDALEDTIADALFCADVPNDRLKASQILDALDNYLAHRMEVLAEPPTRYYLPPVVNEAPLVAGRGQRPDPDAAEGDGRR